MIQKKAESKVDEEVPFTYDHLIDYYFTDEYAKAYSIDYQDGDRYINEFRQFWSIVAYMTGQTTGEEDLDLVFEKNLFEITCPFFTRKEDFYLESLEYYLLFFGFYNTINITSLLEKSSETLKVSNFYNRNNLHFFCFYNDTFTDFSFDLTDKIEKNIQMIASMAPLLWDNGYYKLRRDVLEVGGKPLLVNGETLTLDIVSKITLDPLPPDFFVEPMSATIFLGKQKEFGITYVGGVSPDSIEISVNDITKATAVLDNNIITVTALVAGEVTLTVSSTEVAKIQEVKIRIKAMSFFGIFKSNNLEISRVDGRFVNLDTVTGELTFAPSDNLTIFPCGLTNSAPSSEGTMRVLYLKKKKANGSSGIALSEPGGYIPSEGQPFVVANGFIAAPGSGEVIPHTVVVRNTVENYYVIAAEKDITDVDLVSQYDLGSQ